MGDKWDDDKAGADTCWAFSVEQATARNRPDQSFIFSFYSMPLDSSHTNASLGLSADVSVRVSKSGSVAWAAAGGWPSLPRPLRRLGLLCRLANASSSIYSEALAYPRCPLWPICPTQRRVLCDVKVGILTFPDRIATRICAGRCHFGIYVMTLLYTSMWRDDLFHVEQFALSAHFPHFLPDHQPPPNRTNRTGWPAHRISHQFPAFWTQNGLAKPSRTIFPIWKEEGMDSKADVPPNDPPLAGMWNFSDFVRDRTANTPAVASHRKDL